MPDLRSLAQLVMQQLALLGVNVNPSSRIARVSDFFWSADGAPRGSIEPSDPRLHDALEGIRDLQQFAFILNTLPQYLPVDDLKSRLSRCLKDHVLPEQRGASTPGRDTQAELFVMTVCHNANMQPRIDERPDLRCMFEQEELGIAVKRPKSQSHFEHTIRRAADQIHDSGVPGFIALDTSLLFNQGNDRIVVAIGYDEFARLHAGFFKNFINEHRAAIDVWTRGKCVRGILIHDHQMRHDPREGWQQSSLHFMVPLPIDSTLRNARRFKSTMAFIEAYQRGCPEDR